MRGSFDTILILDVSVEFESGADATTITAIRVRRGYGDWPALPEWMIERFDESLREQAEAAASFMRAAA